MEIERALSNPPSALSRRLRLVAAHEHGVGPEQLRWIGTDPDLFEAFYREHVEDLQRFVARRIGDRERAGEERLRGSVLLDEEDTARMDARLDAAAQSRRLYAAMDRLPSTVATTSPNEVSNHSGASTWAARVR